MPDPTVPSTMTYSFLSVCLSVRPSPVSPKSGFLHYGHSKDEIESMMTTFVAAQTGHTTLMRWQISSHLLAEYGNRHALLQSD